MKTTETITRVTCDRCGKEIEPTDRVALNEDGTYPLATSWNGLDQWWDEIDLHTLCYQELVGWFCRSVVRGR